MAEDTGQTESASPGYAEFRDIEFQRLPDGGVKIYYEGHTAAAHLNEEEWITATAAMSSTGVTELSLNAAALVHRGTAEISVQVLGEAVARLSLRLATGREQQKPELIQAKKPPLSRSGPKLILPR